jgi:hypothetical protein
MSTLLTLEVSMTRNRFRSFLGLLLIASIGVGAPARKARADGTSDTTGSSVAPGCEDRPRGVGLEVNVLWPFFPGGISELRLMVPVVRTDRADFRGELVLGAYSDFATRVVRHSDAGKVAALAGKLGWRQFLVSGLHVEVSANLGWRHESERPPDGVTIDGFAIRLWMLAGYQHEFSRVFYGNVRGGLGVHVYRSDAYASLERKLAPGADLNLGVRF